MTFKAESTAALLSAVSALTESRGRSGRNVHRRVTSGFAGTLRVTIRQKAV
ncbi:MAG: hypothetical protein LBR29_08125 [Methylobacteriaceae bacterium]|jgi:hypothetical protein|nr:hypothetical protein [Methylobacteriaceae bacterium]